MNKGKFFKENFGFILQDTYDNNLTVRIKNPVFWSFEVYENGISVCKVKRNIFSFGYNYFYFDKDGRQEIKYNIRDGGVVFYAREFQLTLSRSIDSALIFMNKNPVFCGKETNNSSGKKYMDINYNGEFLLECVCLLVISDFHRRHIYS